MVACARDASPLHELEGCEAVEADVRTDEGRRALVDAVAKTGGLDILVNNVGTNIRGATASLADDDYRTVVETNLDAAARGRAEPAPAGPGFAASFERTTPAVQRRKNRSKRCSRGRGSRG